MGWPIFFAMALACAAALWRLGRPGGAAVQLIPAALCVAAAGYTWQGRPGLAGHPVTAHPDGSRPDAPFADERKDWMDTVGPDPQVLDAADVWIARGEPDYAIGILRGALARNPKSAMLWLGLGNALVNFADGTVTPAARFAFDRAAALAPGSPAPPYFLGLAYALSGDLDSAEALWGKLLRAAPVAAPWRLRVGYKLLLLQRLRQSQ